MKFFDDKILFPDHPPVDLTQCTNLTERGTADRPHLIRRWNATLDSGVWGYWLLAAEREKAVR